MSDVNLSMYMSGLISSIITYLENLATLVPLELFAFLGTIIEEVIAPIPSPLVMTLTGTIAKAQNTTVLYLLLIALIGSFGKTIGSWGIYVISDKAEDIIIGKFGKFFGVTHKEVEKLGKFFSRTGKDYWTIGILRAIPIMSTALVSIGCGVLRVNLKSFIISTFIGNIFRNIFFLYIGYTGLAASESISRGLESSETILQFILIGLVGIVLIYGYLKRSKNNLFFIKDKDKTKTEKVDENISSQK